MKRNFNAVIKSLDGQSFKEFDASDAKDLTLGSLCINSLGSIQEGDDSLSGEQKFKLYELAGRIMQGVKAEAPVEIAADEIVTLKNRIAKMYAVFPMGAAFKLLDTDYTE